MTKEKINEITSCKLYYLSIFFASFFIIFLALLFKNFTIAFLGLMFWWLGIIIYCLGNIEKRMFLLMFNLMIFVFILDRPFIDIIRGNNWLFSDKVLLKTILALYISMIFLLLGNIVYEKIIDKKVKKIEVKEKKNLKRILICFLIVTFVFNFYTEVYTYIKMHNLDYALIYTSVAPRFNIIIRIMSTLFPYAVITFLAIIPTKKETFISLFLLMIAAIPSFLLGSRNGLMLRLFFVVSYILIRCFINKNEKWITKKMAIISIIILPLLVAFLGAYNYIRDDKKVESFSVINLSLDFFYKQGTTFDTIGQGFQYENTLKNNFNVISYTFGDVIDYIGHNTISKKIFKTVDLGNGNNMNMIMYGNSMAHNLSYTVLGASSYLSGHGRGTSYLIETYIDFNYFGVAIYSLLIGLFLSSIVDIIKKNKFIINCIVLTMLFQIFLLPRYSATGFVTFLVTPQFWLIPISALFINHILNVWRKKNE